MKHLSNFKQAFFISLLLLAVSYGYSQTPVAYFPMYGNGTDTVVRELISNNDGIIKDYQPGNVTFVDGKVGTALSFTLPDTLHTQYVEIPTIDFMTGGSFSVAFWMELDTAAWSTSQKTTKPTNTYPFIVGDYEIFFRIETDVDPDWMRWEMYDSTGARRRLMRRALKIDDPLEDGTDSIDLTNMFDKKWMFVVGTNNLDSSSLFIDGKFVQSNKAAQVGYKLTGPIRLAGSNFAGKFDEMRMYNIALNAVQVQQLYNLTTHAELQTKEYKLTHYPNPFKDMTTISYDLQKAGKVSLEIYNINGQLVKTLVNNEYQQLSTYKINWDCRSESGQSQPSSLYFYKLSVDNEMVGVGKMTLIK